MTIKKGYIQIKTSIGDGDGDGDGLKTYFFLH